MIILWNFDTTKGLDKARKILFAITSFRQIEDSFLYGVKKIVCYIEDIVISRFHGNGSPSLMTKLPHET